MTRELIEAYVTASTTCELKEAEAGLILNDRTFFNTNTRKFKTLDNVRWHTSFMSFVKKGYLAFENGFNVEIHKLVYSDGETLYMLDIFIGLYNVGSTKLDYRSISGSKEDINRALISIQLLEGPSVRDWDNLFIARINVNSIHGSYGKYYSKEMETLLEGTYVKSLPSTWDDVNAEDIYPKTTIQLSKRRHQKMYPNHVMVAWNPNDTV